MRNPGRIAVILWLAVCRLAIAAPAPVDSIAALKSHGDKSAFLAHAKVTRYWPGIAGGGGTFDWVAGACLPDDGVWIDATGVPPMKGCWHRNLVDPGTVSLSMFGVHGDGTTSDYRATANALAYLGRRKGGGTLSVSVPRKRYALDAESLAGAPLRLPRNVTVRCTSMDAIFQVTGTRSYDYMFKAEDPGNSYIRNCGFDGNGNPATAGIEFYGTASAVGPMRDFGASGVVMRNFQATGWIRIDNYATCTTCQMQGVDLTRQTCVSAQGNDAHPGSRSYQAACILLMGQLGRAPGNANGTINDIDFSGQHAEGQYLKDAVACYSGCNGAHGSHVSASDFGAGHTAGSNGSYTYLAYGNGPPGSTVPHDFRLVNPVIRHPFTGALYCAGVVRCSVTGGTISGQDDMTGSGNAILPAAIHFNGCRDCEISNVSLEDNFRAIVLDQDVGDQTKVSGNNISYRLSVAGAIGVQIDTATLGTGMNRTDLLNNDIDLSAAPESHAYLFISNGAGGFDPGTIHLGGGRSLARYAAVHAYDSGGGGYAGSRILVDGDAFLGGPASSALVNISRSNTVVTIDGAIFDGKGAMHGLYAPDSPHLEIRHATFFNWTQAGKRAVTVDAMVCQKFSGLVFRNAIPAARGCGGAH